MTREVVIGIDFGTSCTSAGALIDGRVELLQDAGDPVVPSVVYYPDRGAPEVGRTAALRQLTDPSRVIRSIKRVIGVPADSPAVRRFAASSGFRVDTASGGVMLKLRSGDCPPEQVAAAVLGRIREIAERSYGGQVRKAVITMSAEPPPHYREALLRAARIAHLDVLDVVSEPIAGGLAIGLHGAPADRKVLVCDFGGGTFDVSAIVQAGMKFTPVATCADPYLGGDDLDEALAEGIAGTIFRQRGYDMHRDITRWNQLVYRCEHAKRQLSTQETARVAMREAYVHGGATHDLDVTLDRPWVWGKWAPLMERAEAVIRETIKRAGWSAMAIDMAALIGGTSLVPRVQHMVGAIVGSDRVRVSPHADVAVALGATLLTARYGATPGARLPVLDAA